MLTGDLKSKIDKVWEAFWTGGVSNPLTVIEQITYLLFIRRLDEEQTRLEFQSNRTGKAIEKPIFSEAQQHLRWNVVKNKAPEALFDLFRQPDGVFEFMKNYGAEDADPQSFQRFMKGAVFMIPTPRLLQQVVDLLDAIPMDDRDTKGDVYEYLLSKIASAGRNGQFRTPRHIIKMMVEMTRPTPEDTICDPSAGTCGFLVAASEHLRTAFPKMLFDDAQKARFQGPMFQGIEFDATMIRIGAMNLMLHGIESPALRAVDALSKTNANFDECCSLILANPPFKGSLDADSVHPAILETVKSKKTELLFLALMLRGLQTGGRAAVIVPDGVLFGSSKAHKAIRKALVDGQKLQAVISMPSGVFKPYAGVSTAVLFFTKTQSGGTDKVWFYDMQADGYSLDDKRNPTDANDIPDIIARWGAMAAETDRKRTEQSFRVPVAEIRENGYDLSINRYKEIVYEKVEYEEPKFLIEKIAKLDEERKDSLEILKSLIKAS